MGTLVIHRAGAPGETILSTGREAPVFSGPGTNPDFVENLTPASVGLTPAEAPGIREERMDFIHQYPFAVMDDDDLDEDEDDDLDEDLDDLDLDDEDLEDEDVADVDDADLDDEDLDADLDDDDEDEDEEVI